MPEKELKGIGGWLLFYTLMLCIGLILNIYLTYLDVSNQASGDIAVTIPSILILGFSLNSIFNKETYAPKANIISLWIIFALSTFSLILMRGSISTIILSLIGTLIWTNYWKKSVRVKNTFVN